MSDDTDVFDGVEVGSCAAIALTILLLAVAGIAAACYLGWRIFEELNP